jgi:hypothetical protein
MYEQNTFDYLNKYSHYSTDLSDRNLYKDYK